MDTGKKTYVVSHISEASRPVGCREVGVSPPTVSIASRAAPHALGDMVVEMNKDLLLRTLGGHGIKDLQPGSTRGELGILGQELVEHLWTVC